MSAPHATIIDAIPIFISDAVPVAKDVIKKYFMLGTIGRFQQVNGPSCSMIRTNDVKDFL